MMCPCRVKGDIEDFWERVFDMTDDIDADVRFQVLHTLCDGSPVHLEDRVIDAVASFNGDESKTLRRKAHQVRTMHSVSIMLCLFPPPQGRPR